MSHWLCRVLFLMMPMALCLAAFGEPREQEILQELESSFERDLISAWYPQSIDEDFGGYRTGFGSDWVPTDETDKYLVGQSRHIWVLSKLAAFKEDETFLRQAEYGYRFLVETMWDDENGGFHEAVTQEGEPISRFGKSAYGMSFSIYALAALYKETGDEAVLEFAKSAFAWLEAHSWDSENQGYVDDMDLRGRWIPKRIDGIDTVGLGTKDYNSSIHILECFTVLYSVWPNETLRLRLEQMLEIVRDRFVQDPAYLHLIFNRNWERISFRSSGRDAVMAGRFFDHVSWGHDVETAFLMLEAAEALYGEVDEKTAVKAKALVDHALDTGWDEDQGSLFEGGYYFEDDEAPEVIMPKKVWWIAAESLNASLLMSQLYPNQPKYFEAFVAQWTYIKDYLLDSQNGGWLATGLDSDPKARLLPKASQWKACYHDARAYLNCIEMLRGEFALTKH